MALEFPSFKNELPRVPHKLTDEPLRQTVAYHLEHLRRDTEEGRLAPAPLWILLRGLLLGAMQGYASVCILLAAKRPKPLMLQAGIINRSIFETLVNIGALIGVPARFEVLNKEAFKHLALRFQSDRELYGHLDKWAGFLDVFRTNLESSATLLGLDSAMIDDPHKIEVNWPTPFRLIFGDKKRGIPAWVAGNRQDVLGRLYQRHYPQQSALAHERAAAVSAAMLVDKPEFQWNPGMVRATSSLTPRCSYCVLSRRFTMRPTMVRSRAWSKRGPIFARVTMMSSTSGQLVTRDF